MSPWVLFTVAVLILINAFYVAAEFAAVATRATRVEQLALAGHRLASRLLPVLKDPAYLDRYIAACQIGITASSLVLGAFGQATLGLALGGLLVSAAGLEPVAAYALSATLTLVFLSSLQVVLGELIPKTLALQYPLRMALLTYLPMRASLALFSPFIRLLNGSGSLVLRLLGQGAQSAHRHVHSPDEIELLIRESRAGGVLDARESERLREALRLARHGVRQIMVPRRRILTLDLREPGATLLAQAAASPYTRLPVHRGGLETVQGFLHVKDLALALAAGEDGRDMDIAGLIRPILFLPSSLTVDRTLAQMRERRARIALLVDEYGEVEGLVSVEDIVRELLGALSDELKSGSRPGEPVRIAAGRWRLPGRLPRDEAAEWARSVGADWAPSEAETLAGWIIERLDAIPAGPCCLRVGALDLTVEQLDGAAIASVLAQVPTAEPGGPEGPRAAPSRKPDLEAAAAGRTHA